MGSQRVRLGLPTKQHYACKPNRRMIQGSGTAGGQVPRQEGFPASLILSLGVWWQLSPHGPGVFIYFLIFHSNAHKSCSEPITLARVKLKDTQKFIRKPEVRLHLKKKEKMF